MKIRPLGAELFNADGQKHRETNEQRDRNTEMTKLRRAFRKFVYPHENGIHYPKLKNKWTLALKSN
jgi:hypothetical protein